MARFGAYRAEGDGLDDLSPRLNGSPGQDYPIIVREPDVAGALFMRSRWGLIPRGMKTRRADRDRSMPAPKSSRSSIGIGGALMPIHSYFEWKAIRGERAKQPCAIAMKSGELFALAAKWDS